MSELPVEDARSGLATARRIVVKVGSRTLQDPARFGALAAQIAALPEGTSVVLVSSGAIALGRAKLGLERRPRAMAKLQAAAAVGQSALMRAWEDAFEAHGRAVAQILLSHADLVDRERYLNARHALDALLELGAVPIINENDTVAVEEIRFGDNDQLAALVAALVGADLLLLLTDVDGVLDGAGQRIAVVRDVADAMAHVRAPTDDVGRGGMASKIEAARRAARHGVPVVIARAAREGLLASVLQGDDVGTLVLPQGARLASRKHWIAYALRPKGVIFVDAGAAKALRGGASLLPAGVTGVRGGFVAGDAVDVVCGDDVVGRGLCRFDTADVARVAGASKGEVEGRLGRAVASGVVIHRDDLVV